MLWDKIMAIAPNKTVFISYRRSVSKHLARSIYMDLTHHGYDAFLDVSTIDNGAFDSVILNQINARTHFVILLSSGALERCKNGDDWLRREIEEALKLKRNIVPIIEEGFDFDPETAYLPEEWRAEFKRISGIRLFHDFFDEAMARLRDRYLKQPDFVVELKSVSKQEQQVVEQRKAEIIAPSLSKIETPSAPKIIAPKKPTSLDLMPKPFAWIDIPKGKVTLEAGGYLKKPTTFDVPAFQIAKYPTTNAQFDVFVNYPEGYMNPVWWNFSEDAKKWRASNKIPQTTGFSSDTMPRTNVTWYESVAFCRWISAVTGENIMLPSEQQWQWAAQGDDGRQYPWGKKWDASRCNNNVDKKGIGKTTPVTQYEGKGDSPYKVVDMAGNVWEWCSTDWAKGGIDLNGINACVLRGGSWSLNESVYFSAVYRNNVVPYDRLNRWGFRFARFF
jgi:formylglycine-generating enzyme required for sulfatase activity